MTTSDPDHTPDRRSAEQRFASVFAQLNLVTAYARRRGARDPEAIAAEVMTIAWRRLADVPVDEPRPWLIRTAQNLLLEDRRRQVKERALLARCRPAEATEVDPSVAESIDPALTAALLSLSVTDREAVLLVAWEDLTPALAAACLGISAVAFRVRLLRARRRLRTALAEHPMRLTLTEQT